MMFWNLFRFFTGFILLIVALTSAPSLVLSDDRPPPKQQILDQIPKHTLTNFIQPLFSDLETDSALLVEQSDHLCSIPSSQNLQQLRELFSKTVLIWAQVEHIKFGPMIKDYRAERLVYWPDRKGRGIRRVKKTIRIKDKSVLNPGQLAQKSVALQGLTALEYILYSKESEILATTESESKQREFLCQYAHSIAKNVNAISKDLSKEFGDDAPFAKAFLFPGESNPHYRNRQEILLAVFQAFINGLKDFNTRKIQHFLGATPETARPKSAPFWRSNLSRDVLITQLQTYLSMALKSGYLDLIAGGEIDLKLFIIDKINELINQFKKLPNDFKQILTEPKHRKQLVLLNQELSKITIGLARNLAVEANLSLGFNASDGD